MSKPTSTGRRGTVNIHRNWLADPDLSDSGLRLMLWLDSHTDEYLAAMNISRCAEEIGWSRNRVKRAVEELESLGLIETEQMPRQYGGTVTRFTLHMDTWTDGPSRTSAMVHGEARAVVHHEAPSTSKHIELEQQESVAAEADDSPAHQLCEQLADHIEQLGAKRPAITNAWLQDMDRAIRIDQRTPDQLANCIRWLSTPNRDAQFWSTNILSPRKLRVNFDKMALQARASKTPQRNPTPIEQARAMRAERKAISQ